MRRLGGCLIGESVFKKKIRIVHLNIFFTSQTLSGRGSVFGVRGLVLVSALPVTGSGTLSRSLSFLRLEN